MQPSTNNPNITPLSSPFLSEKMGVKVKVCGMKYPENILELAALQPDYLGFIFWDKSSRYFDGEMPAIPSFIKKVGVFVQEEIEVILAKAEKYNLQAIQLHGNESVSFCSDLKEKLEGKRIEIIKVFSVNDTFDFQELEPFETVCDYFLFDTKGKLPGGNGTTFDWRVLEKYPSLKPFFLSGGISLDEVESIQQILNTNLPIHALDLNSKFETEPGLKDITLLQKLQHNLQL